MFAIWVSEIARDTTSFAWICLHSLIDIDFEFFSISSAMDGSDTLEGMASMAPEREHEKNLIKVDRRSIPYLTDGSDSQTRFL